jgi:predicted signal transduction protein with EAL and GGDEF domain
VSASSLNLPSLSRRIALAWLAATLLAALLSTAAWFTWRGVNGAEIKLLCATLAAQVSSAALLLALLVRLRQNALRPVAQLVEQLSAASEERFVYFVQPDAQEWAAPFRAANIMVARLQKRHDERNQQFSALREEVDTDRLTGLPSRVHFMQALGLALTARTETPSIGAALVVVRVEDLVGVNQRMGRERGDELLASIAMLLRMHLVRLGADKATLSRLNGADFGVIVSGVAIALLEQWLHDLSEAFIELHHNAVADRAHVAWLGATRFSSGEALADVMSRADAMVQACEAQKLPYRLTHARDPVHAIAMAQWRLHIEHALETGQISMELFPVLARDGGLFHHEAVLRMTLPGGAVMPGARVVPPALRSGRIMDLDLRMIELALVHLNASPGSSVCVNVATQSTARPFFLDRLKAILSAAGDATQRLCLEVEEGALDGPAALADLATLSAVLQPFGVRLGIDHFANQLPQAYQLGALGVSFVKVDALLCEGLATGLAPKEFCATLRILLGHHPCDIVATGLRNPADLTEAWACHFNAATGPAVTALMTGA